MTNVHPLALFVSLRYIFFMVQPHFHVVGAIA